MLTPLLPLLLLLLLLLHLLPQIKCGQCEMSAIVSFQDCVYFCVNKYGENDNTQRKYYNRYTGTCEKAVTCTSTLFRVYQNRCLGDFQSFLIGERRVSLPEIYEEVVVVMVHGNFNAIKDEDKCYPGFFSSKKRIKIGIQVYQQYYCDIPIGSDPITYPSSHGQYFFNNLQISTQISVVEADCPTQPTFDIGYGVLLGVEAIFVGVGFWEVGGMGLRRIRRSWGKG